MWISYQRPKMEGGEVTSERDSRVGGGKSSPSDSGVARSCLSSSANCLLNASRTFCVFTSLDGNVLGGDRPGDLALSNSLLRRSC